MLDTVNIVIRLADLRITNSSANAPAIQKQKAFAIFDILADITRALHGWTANQEHYGRLQRVQQTKINRKDGVRLYEVTFRCALINTVANHPSVNVTGYTPNVVVAS
jgi:hypothetical protein